MTALWLPAAFALFVWWFSTGAIFWLSRLGAAGRRQALLGASALLLAALGGIWAVRDTASIPAAYASFACGVAVWAWVEIGFLFGVVTGPRKRPCPADADGFGRFAYAVAAILWHELAILALGTITIVLSLGHPNQVGAWTFVLLMGMRLSAKINLFLGVPYPPRELLPVDLAHLGSFFRTAPLNPFLPVVITGSTALLTLIAWRLSDPSLDHFHVTAYALFATMLALGIVEHWFLALPVRESALWKWFLESGASRPPAATRAVDSGVRKPYVAGKPGGGLEARMPAPIKGG